MNLQDPALTFALALVAGVLAQSIARHLRVPGIVILLATGIGLGPEGIDLIRPDILGAALQPVVGLSVAVILFEGALQLNARRLRTDAVAIRRLITVGALVTMLGGTLLARLVLGWDWQLSLLLGALIVVTGPTVINPLTRRIKPRPNVRTILEAEGVLIDPIGAVLAVVVLEMVLATTTRGAAAGLLGLPYTLGLGLVIGVAGGIAIAGLMRLRNVVPGEYHNIFTLASVLALYQASNAILPESGIMTVAIAGLVVGNIRTPGARELAEFKEQLTILLVGLLFVLLAAAVPLEDVRALGWRGVLFVVGLIVLVRPADVAVSTAGTALGLRERAFIAWLAPRGIVAFAISSLFADELAHQGLAAEGAQFRAMVFLVIAMTVVIQGGTAGLVARWLGILTPSNDGYAIVGANALGRALARALRAANGPDTPIVLIDSNPSEARHAEESGFRVIFGNASDERTLRQAAVESRRAFVALTPNEGVNLLLAGRMAEIAREVRRLVAISRTEPDVLPEQVREAGASVLFGAGIDFERWAHELRQDRIQTGAWAFQGESGTRIGELPQLSDPRAPLLPLVRRRGNRGDPVHDGMELRPDDIVWFAWFSSDEPIVRRTLESDGWMKESPEEVPGLS